MTKQVQEIIAKVKAGEYQTEAECIEAFRAMLVVVPPANL